jgi:hypothetical protein
VALFTFKDVLNTKGMDAQYLGAWDIWLAAAKLCVLLGMGSGARTAGFIINTNRVLLTTQWNRWCFVF